MTSEIEHEDVLVALVDAMVTGRAADPTIRGHLASCPPCAAEWTSITRTAGRLGGASDELRLDATMPTGLRERVRAGIAPRRMAPEPRRSRWGPIRWSALGALATAGVFLVVMFLRPALDPVVETFEIIGGADAAGLEASVEIRPLAGGSASMRLMTSDLPPSEEGEFYELWWVGPEKRHVSCGTFRSDGSSLDLMLTSGIDIEETVLVEITREQDDGDAAPGPHVGQSRPSDAGPDWTPAP